MIGADPALSERIRASLSRSPFHFLDSPAPLPASEVDLYLAPERTAEELLEPAAGAGGPSPSQPPVIAHGPGSLLRAAFLAGAADYLRDPWSPDELALRALAVLQRARARFTLPWGCLSQDGSLLESAGGPVRFTWHEAALLRALARGRGAPVSREVLEYALWGRPAKPGSRAVDVHVAVIRRKIATVTPGDPHPPIVAVRSRGYMVR